ncbi:MAG: hypothetical protein EPO32_10210 [Anaerolineae bacterium]|nr:MAG: hypothetical protein EPO32_10210 [Anaerolineae bacterium]
MPAKGNPRIGAANRYFGKFLDGTLKIRGLAQRRSDTSDWIARVEAAALAALAGDSRDRPLDTALPDIVALAGQAVAALQAGRAPLEDLVVWRKLTREPDEYRGRSASGAAARQLRAAGKDVQVGQSVGLLYIKVQPPGARAWWAAVRARAGRAGPRPLPAVAGALIARAAGAAGAGRAGGAESGDRGGAADGTVAAETSEP